MDRMSEVKPGKRNRVRKGAGANKDVNMNSDCNKDGAPLTDLSELVTSDNHKRYLQLVHAASLSDEEELVLCEEGAICCHIYCLKFCMHSWLPCSGFKLPTC